MIFPETVNT